VPGERGDAAMMRLRLWRGLGLCRLHGLGRRGSLHRLGLAGRGGRAGGEGGGARGDLVSSGERVDAAEAAAHLTALQALLTRQAVGLAADARRVLLKWES
jgi:hypothetical protein